LRQDGDNNDKQWVDRDCEEGSARHNISLAGCDVCNLALRNDALLERHSGDIFRIHSNSTAVASPDTMVCVAVLPLSLPSGSPSNREPFFANTTSTRYFPYYITVTSLVILWLFMLIWLMSQNRLLPAVVMLGAFVLFILWLVGLIVVSIELWGPKGSVNSACNIQVFSQPKTGDSVETLAWLQQRSICKNQAYQRLYPDLPSKPTELQVNLGMSSLPSPS
jgi:hypothetical protein